VNAYLLLGCNGYVSPEHFKYCSSICNPVIDLSKANKETSERIINFLDRACGLFDSACYDYNKCINIINLLYKQYSIIDEDMLHNIQAFLRMHKRCGIYIMLILKEDYHV
jgi:uncharacterized protein YutE (UPF0331/DUF86 family)